MLFNLLAGLLLAAYHNYTLIFMILGLLHPLSLVIILIVVRKIEPLRTPWVQRGAEARV
jgi:hypothetical protein